MGSAATVLDQMATMGVAMKINEAINPAKKELNRIKAIPKTVSAVKR